MPYKTYITINPKIFDSEYSEKFLHFLIMFSIFFPVSNFLTRRLDTITFLCRSTHLFTKNRINVVFLSGILLIFR